MGLFTFKEIRDVCGGSFSRSVPLTASVDEVVTDSRQVMKNALFIALSGEKFDAHDFLEDAVRNGAALLCVEADKADKVPAGAFALLVDSPLTAYQQLAGYHRKRFPDLKLADPADHLRTCSRQGTRSGDGRQYQQPDRRAAESPAPHRTASVCRH